ncbi:non-ribosomal peptide synthetase [Aliikangiella coralliicola]|uniref:Amino acid adenylation domain-containing protein n=1 Tax=Aliikangiella coralliicola TaxID=2592383 RepID=A0A545U962_9GAMM|nr:non-ribosomal peptide synthetase [Aliikangiella coralliicola]TQV86008.1 amino acid adenylation domain-containing protein [Aliikangiella coralliicola]
MTVFALINKVHAKGIKLWEEGGQLKLKTPKGALTEEIREQLVANKSDIIAFLQQVSTTNKIPPILPVDRNEHQQLPLSFAQERLWFIEQLEGPGASYNVPGALMIKSELDIAQVEKAFSIIVARHDNLRTTFPTENGVAQQKILEEIDFKLEIIDLNEDKSINLEDVKESTLKKAKQLCQVEAATPFDLASGPLIRGKIIKLAQHAHILILNMHHIISDGWSIAVLIKEFGAIMEGLEQGNENMLPPLPIQYVDYSVWQRKWLEEGGVLEQQLTYWQQKLDGVAESLALATDYPRQSVQSFNGANYSFKLESPLTEKLKELSEQNGCTLFMTLLAAFKVLLFRYSGQEDICVGSPIANRQYGETESLIGMFVNTLALRSELTGEDSFETVLNKVKRTCLEAYEHQDTPFEKIVERVQPQRNMAMSPLFQVMVILQNIETDSLDSQIQPYPLDTSISKFDLTVEFTETSQGLSALFEYSTALFKSDTMVRMAEHFRHLCNAIVAAPETKIKSFNFIEKKEQDRLLIEFNNTAVDYPKDQCLHQLFAAQAKCNPDNVAVVFEQTQMTYRQLFEKSSELAFYLQDQGIKPDDLVGICLRRSPSMLIAMLGILQAGAAYVPLDPEYPDERLAYILKDSQAHIVLTEKKLKEKLNQLVAANTQLIAIDQQGAEISKCVAELKNHNVELRQLAAPENLAYIIYTSGSTGQPKGVAIEHHSPVTLINWASDVYSRQELSGVLASTSICFDLSVYEIFLTLANGGKIILVPNALEIVNLEDKSAVSLINTVPSAIEELVRLNAIPESVQTINLAGEPLLPTLVDKIYQHSQVKKVYDLYGPSEDTTYSTFILREKNAPQTIGRPIANTQVYILDQNLNSQPIGVPGELHIAGDGLARGYLNQPQLTHEKFIENPFYSEETTSHKSSTKSRLYRTGDLARWLDNGTIEYLGRIDTQVKIRGFRIEIGEIESQLNDHPQIKSCAVVAQGEGAGKQLVAFYVINHSDSSPANNSITNDSLKNYLKQSLPEYMLPANFVSLETIPLTQNGKINRRVLESLEVSLESSQVYVAPSNQSEKILTKIWAEVLNLDAEKIGVNDNFFELGGHSLLAVQLLAKINQQFRQSLPLSILFATPDIASLAEKLRSKNTTVFDILVPIQPEGNNPPVFAMPGVGGNVLSLQPLSRALGNTQPFYGLQAVGVDGKSTPFYSVEQTAVANVNALRRIQQKGPYRLLGHSYGGVVAFEMARLLLEQNEEIHSLILLDSVAPSIARKQVVSDEITTLIEVCTKIAELSDIQLTLNVETLQQVAQSERNNYVAQLMITQGVDISVEQFNTYYKVFEANERCYRDYHPLLLPKNIKVYLYRAVQGNGDILKLADDYGWGELLNNSVDIQDVHADHFSLLEKEHIGKIADSILNTLTTTR